MELKLNQISQTRPHQDTLYTIEEGVYESQTFKELITSIQEYVTSKGYELVNIEPIKMTVRQYLDVEQKPSVEEIVAEEVE